MKRLAVAMSILCASCGGPVEIRFENASPQTFDAMEVGFGEGAQFQDLRPGEVTEYQEFDGAYSYGFVRAVIGLEEYRIQPIDYTGEEQLDPGKYTHRLSITGAPPGVLIGVTRADD